jgi:hypothetical protein
MEATYCGLCGLPMIEGGCPICDGQSGQLNRDVIDSLIVEIMSLRGIKPMQDGGNDDTNIEQG